METRYAVAFTGPSNSGKTTVIEKIALRLSPHKSVVVVKHDPKDKALFDREGKDSARFFAAGADTVIVSPTRTTYFSHRSHTLHEIEAMIGTYEYLIVEGLKTWPLPRIGVFRGTIDETYLPYCQAIAVDDTIDVSAYDLPADIAVLDLNDPDRIIAWIEHHAPFNAKG